MRGINNLFLCMILFIAFGIVAHQGKSDVLTPSERFTPGDRLQGWKVLSLQELLDRTDGLSIQLRGQKVPFSRMLLNRETKEVALRRSDLPCLRGDVLQLGSLIKFTWDNGEVDMIKPLLKGKKSGCSLWMRQTERNSTSFQQ